MTDPRLLPCPSCARHVRVSEMACPFCTAELPSSLQSQPLPRSPGTRLSRAALYAFGASATALVACGGTGSTLGDAGRDGSSDPIGMPVYGGPVADGGEDAFPTVDAAYGGPPQDGGDGDAIAPPYGLPPP